MALWHGGAGISVSSEKQHAAARHGKITVAAQALSVSGGKIMAAAKRNGIKRRRKTAALALKG
jgi:RNase P protein component